MLVLQPCASHNLNRSVGVCMQMLLPPYGGLQGAGSGRHHAHSAIHPVVVEPPAPHPEADGAAAAQLQVREHLTNIDISLPILAL
jgi:hypothetical protein